VYTTCTGVPTTNNNCVSLALSFSLSLSSHRALFIAFDPPDKQWTNFVPTFDATHRPPPHAPVSSPDNDNDNDNDKQQQQQTQNSNEKDNNRMALVTDQTKQQHNNKTQQLSKQQLSKQQSSTTIFNHNNHNIIN